MRTVNPAIVTPGPAVVRPATAILIHPVWLCMRR